MRDEISAAVLFLARLIEKSENFNQDQLQDFKDRLSELLQERFENHWFPDKPDKGQGYRCIRVNGVNRRDPTLEKAANACGIKYEDMKLPFELTIWVDPNEVCCRFGESKGSFCTLASFCDKEIMDSSSGSEESSEDSMKGNSPSPLSTPTKQSLQVSVREKSGGGLVRIRTSRAGDAVKLGGNNNGRGRRGYYQYHHHHHHHHHQNQHNQPWYSLISPPWMGGGQQQQQHHNGNNNNNSNNNNISSTLTSTVNSTTSSTSPVTSTTHNNVINGVGGGGGVNNMTPTTQFHHNNVRTRWPSTTTTTTTSSANHYYFHHNHNRYESSTSQKSALKV